MTRGQFMAGVASLGVKGLGGDLFAADVCDRRALQLEIDEVPVDVFKRYLHEGGPASCRALERLDAAFDKVLHEVRVTTVVSHPAVWLVYNMGVVVKTPKTLFAVDLCHPRSAELAPLLDFAVITHNHLDHYTERFYQEMNGRFHKTVIQNFRDNYGAAFHGGVGGFSRGIRDFDFKDVHVRTGQSDHNTILQGFVMPVELTVGDYSILHVGDTHDVENLRPARRPDLWIHHPRCWKDETARGVARLKPRRTVVAHLHEMQHPKDHARFTFADGEAAKAVSEQLGSPAVVPHWGDRIA